ncbi:MAG: UvrD-helicase domain-containing protein, partial [Blastocatellia bacterium]
MTTTQLADQEARRRIREDLETNFVVEAAAGTGKTTALVERIVAVLKGGSNLREIIAVTFTDPASGELKLRLRKKIEDERQNPGCDPEIKTRLEDSLRQIEEARIGTIHAFCADLLRERPVESGIDPLFEVAPDERARSLFDRAFDRWFEARLDSPGEGVRRILRRKAGEDGPRGLLRSAAWELSNRRDFPAAWIRNAEFDRRSEIDSLMNEMDSLGEWSASGEQDDYFTKSLMEIKKFVDDVRRTESITGGRDYDGLEPRIADLVKSRNRYWNWTGFRRTRSGFPKEELIRRRDQLKARIEQFRDASGADLAPLLRDELWPVVEAYEHLKKRAGCLDFLDLLLRARNLIRDDGIVRNDYQKRFSHLFVDEFQDTDPLQAEILMLIASDDPVETAWRKVKPKRGKLFIVGDPKQSIYRFRRADVLLYESVKERVTSSGGERLDLNVSFRAVPAIQEAVNSAFSLSMNGASSTQARYVPLSPSRSGSGGQPPIVALPVPAPYGDYGKIVEWRIEESLPEAIGAFVDWMINSSDWTVTERERPHERVRIAAHHICLLFRRFRSFNTDVT